MIVMAWVTKEVLLFPQDASSDNFCLQVVTDQLMLESVGTLAVQFRVCLRVRGDSSGWQGSSIGQTDSGR